MKSNSTLTSVQLAFNRIGNEGGKAWLASDFREVSAAAVGYLSRVR